MRTTIIADIGINHNADIDNVFRLIDIAHSAGCDYVKFQKRTPEICVPEKQKNVMKNTPWGEMTYFAYKKKMEFTREDYHLIELHCMERSIKWTASAWDLASLDFISEFNPDFIKIPSALTTDKDFLNMCAMSDDKFVISTGACNWDDVDTAVDILGDRLVGVLHCVSTYPSKVDEQNINCIAEMIKRYPEIKIGFSNHYPGIIFMPIAVAFGASIIEFHITLDRAMWGTDQPASIEPEGVFKVVKYIRNVEKALGDGNKKFLDSEFPIMEKLRRC